MRNLSKSILPILVLYFIQPTFTRLIRPQRVTSTFVSKPLCGTANHSKFSINTKRYAFRVAALLTYL